ncbi:MAG: phosphoribosylaminoimidazolesuccinocarboxamide synthase [Bacillota bacterium]|jgi:phosphoribosylaminoimidazole-succinocarboxamide synthase|nr:phosphoribosylaminoimidazolesuccinocarboxamide synthase [Bacillota bacterium]HOB91108.1 phosphoribosylaminoimidazolesuccinocarboxamide synthase [Bacillota bacterium]HPZ54234.1 phosphoribosylaminoimidazolesuccinocarboxamide synthase [Bacillota bacterium]HQD18712.1 phosphoribosylaminoimidazolesuccinocarboxamide synthase [Bacillota bacterium]
METRIKEVPLLSRGKVRDVYDLGDQLLFVATDRLSAFDVVFSQPIPDKGRVLTGLSAYWFRYTEDIISNHLISDDVDDLPDYLASYREELEGRFMLVKKGRVLPVECVVRGYLAGSGWARYQETGSVTGVKLPPGLSNSSRLPEPIFTPTTKATEGHDLPVTVDQMRDMIGSELTDAVIEKSIELYLAASKRTEECGIILADTKLEFAIIDDALCVVDELVTPDSSRFWSADKYREGENQESFDKQYLRDYLETVGWDKRPPAPILPQHVIDSTRERYLEAYRRIVGEDLPSVLR